jgi:hypothetical protein
VYVSGEFKLDGSIIQNSSVILAASQAIYYVAFKGLGLEAFMFPKNAVVSQAKDTVATDLVNLSTDKARAVLNPERHETLSATAQVVK